MVLSILNMKEWQALLLQQQFTYKKLISKEEWNRCEQKNEKDMDN
jgi:hypothetical protein